jgi:hypothetical protein
LILHACAWEINLLADAQGTNRDEGSTFTGNQTGVGDGQITDQSYYYEWL